MRRGAHRGAHEDQVGGLPLVRVLHPAEGKAADARVFPAAVLVLTRGAAAVRRAGRGGDLPGRYLKPFNPSLSPQGSQPSPSTPSRSVLAFQPVPPPLPHPSPAVASSLLIRTAQSLQHKPQAAGGGSRTAEQRSTFKKTAWQPEPLRAREPLLQTQSPSSFPGNPVSERRSPPTHPPFLAPTPLTPPDPDTEKQANSHRPRPSAFIPPALSP